MADAAHGGFPTVGLYSRFGWNHPGPFAFYAMAPFDWISGGASWGLLLGSAVWSFAALAAAVWLAARRGGLGTVALAVGAQAATWIAMGGAAALDPWTPNLAAVLVVPLVLAAWGAAVGDMAAVAAFLVVAAIAPQVHVGYLVIVAALVVAAAALGWPDRARWKQRTVLVGLAVAGLIWLPVVMDLVLGRTHNVSRLWRYFRSDVMPSAGVAAGARIVALESHPLPTWVTGPRPVGLFAEAGGASWWWLVALAAALVGGRALARERGDHRSYALATICGVSLGAAVVAASQVRGTRFQYLVYWRTPIVVLAIGAAASLFLPELVRRLAPRRRAGPAIVAALLATAAVVGASAAAATAKQVTRHGDDVAPLLASITERPVAPVLVRLADSGFVGTAPAVLRWLDQRGVDAGVDPNRTWVFGDRGLAPERAGEFWYVTDTGWAFSLLSALPGARVIAERTPLDPADEARLVALHRELAAELTAAGFDDEVISFDSVLVELALKQVPGIDDAALNELAGFNERLARPGARFGIVAFAPADSPGRLPWPLAGF